MLIPAAIGLIISTIFLNFNLLTKGVFLMAGQGEPARSGAVLGVSEANSAAEIFIEQNDRFNQAMVKVITEAKTLPLPKLFQPPQLDQPLSQPKDRVEKPAVVITDDNFPAQNALILDYNDDSLFFEKRPDRTWPIASITKLFTAYTFLDYNPGWETSYEIKSTDKREGGKIYLFTGDKVTVKDLFYFSLVGSDNTATAALVAATGLSEAEFMEKMNFKIAGLGFKNTRLVDPAGLRDGNISTAREIALFAKLALAKEEISRAVLTKTYEFDTAQGRKKAVSSTNELLSSFPSGEISLLGGKTGHINASGYCLVGQFNNRAGQAIITVVLGADSNHSRFSLTQKLVDLYYDDQSRL